MNNAEYKCVGSSCLVDFMGHPDAADVAQLFGYLAEACSAAEESEMGGGGGGGFNHFGLTHFLGYVAAAIRNDGWMSRGQVMKMGFGEATVDTAWGVMMKVAADDTSNLNRKYIPVESDFVRGEKALEFIRVFIDGELEKGEVSDYLHNLNLVGRMGTVSRKSAGLAASIIAAADRGQGKEIERRKFSNLKATSQHFAEPGQKVVVACTLMGHRELEGQYGCTTMLKFVSEAGNAVTWFASGSFAEGTWVIGSNYLLAGTVKKNEVYQDLKQTILTRCSVVTAEQVAADAEKAAKKAARAAKKAEKEAQKVA